MIEEELKAYEEQLKPCPFCGGKATFHECLGMSAFEAFCSNENCQVTPITDYYTNPEEAIKAWNKRGKA